MIEQVGELLQLDHWIALETSGIPKENRYTPNKRSHYSAKTTFYEACFNKLTQFIGTTVNQVPMRGMLV
ncbi:MAG: hypothetical protein VXZ38_05430 [Planctomycetota bacterium]|nr:hypothetical protein [Planctomycetota bacterium]